MRAGKPEHVGAAFALIEKCVPLRRCENYRLHTKVKERIFFRPSKFCARVLLQPLRGSFLPEEAYSYTLLL